MEVEVVDGRREISRSSIKRGMRRSKRSRCRRRRRSRRRRKRRSIRRRRRRRRRWRRRRRRRGEGEGGGRGEEEEKELRQIRICFEPDTFEELDLTVPGLLFQTDIFQN